MSEWALEMKGICKKFPGTHALSDVDFYLKAGEIHALIGENGAGKSTLMNVLMGVHKLDKGEILLQGEKIDNNSPYEAMLKGISMVPQELNLIPEISVAENIFLGNEQKKSKNGFLDWKSTARKAVELLDKLGISMDVNRKLCHISAAYQQLVSIARSLAAGSQILILDEPTASLTTNEAELLFNVMRQLRNEGKSIIFITHHLDEVKEIADRVTIMRDSRVVHKDNTENLSIEDMIFYMANKKIEKSVREKREVSREIFLEVCDYNRENEFENISFSVHEGEIFGIAGLIGAGRTELFKTIYGLTKKKSGKIYIQGEEVEIRNPKAAINKGIGYVPEERRRMGMFPVLPIYENMMISSYKQLSKAGFINYSEVRNSADRYIDELHGGNQQKVILARWIAKDVKLLILDEPTRGIDVNAKGEIYKLITKMADKGMTVIVISSEIEELLEITDRIMVMHEGRIKGFIDCPHKYKREDVLAMALQ